MEGMEARRREALVRGLAEVVGAGRLHPRPQPRSPVLGNPHTSSFTPYAPSRERRFAGFQAALAHHFFYASIPPSVS